MVVVIDANVTRPEKRAAEDFVRYLLSEEGQNILAEHHLRPPKFAAGRSTAIPQAFTVDDLGGWSGCYQNLIEGLWKSKIAPQLASKQLPTLLRDQD
jgi:ABC-type sulfate transport system substrate-binding protein